MTLKLPLLAALCASASAFSIVTQQRQQRWSRLYASVEEKSASRATKPLGKPGTAKMDVPWEDLGFEFRPTNSHVRMTYKDGEWGEMELVKVRNRSAF
jgi:branched-chain amino acid aminotransferase